MVYAIIPAAGSGERFGGKTKKQFIQLGGTPILVLTLAVFEKSPLVDEIITVVSKDDHSFVAHLISGYPLSKAKRIVLGGERRQDSIQAAVALLEGEGRPEDIVLVHDGVRPLVSAPLIENVIRATERVGCAVAAMPTGDSLKEVSGKKEIIRSVPRENIWSMQTPQGFRLSILKEAYRNAARDRFDGTDDAMLVERLGISIVCVEGSPENIKITTPSDLRMAELLLHARCIHQANEKGAERPGS